MFVCKLMRNSTLTNRLRVPFRFVNRSVSSGDNSVSSSGARSGPPEPPTNCCMSGCANCVWMKYADELIAYYRDGGEKARKELDRLVNDPTLKMFLRIELDAKLAEDENSTK